MTTSALPVTVVPYQSARCSALHCGIRPTLELVDATGQRLGIYCRTHGRLLAHRLNAPYGIEAMARALAPTTGESQ